MSPATWARAEPMRDRLLVVDPVAKRLDVACVGDLVRYVKPGDLLVVNDAGTFPASLGCVTSTGDAVEVRLLASRGGGWRAVLFGAGDWRTRTEDRPAPPPVREGDAFVFPGGLRAVVASVARESPRLVALRFEASPDHVWTAIHRYGRPVQYAHIAGPLSAWHVQTPFASRPWASEMPSAARPLAWDLVLALRKRGVRFAAVTHAAGLSSTGDASLDTRLPLRESFEVPLETAGAVARTKAEGGRVIAVGTSVVRALESSASMCAPSGESDLVIDKRHTVRWADGILTGIHEPGTSHDALLQAFAPEGLLRHAYERAVGEGFLGHEFGDSMLIARG